MNFIGPMDCCSRPLCIWYFADVQAGGRGATTEKATEDLYKKEEAARQRVRGTPSRAGSMMEFLLLCVGAATILFSRRRPHRVVCGAADPISNLQTSGSRVEKRRTSPAGPLRRPRRSWRWDLAKSPLSKPRNPLSSVQQIKQAADCVRQTVSLTSASSNAAEITALMREAEILRLRHSAASPRSFPPGGDARLRNSRRPRFSVSMIKPLGLWTTSST